MDGFAPARYYAAPIKGSPRWAFTSANPRHPRANLNTLHPSDGANLDVNICGANLVMPSRAEHCSQEQTGVMGLLLKEAIRLLWPRRKKQELWLDLGERKHWSDRDLLHACEQAARQLAAHGLCPEDLGEASVIQAVQRGAKDLRDRAKWLIAHHPRERSTGVGWSTRELAPLVGASPTTFANSLSDGFRPDRLDHLWMEALADPDSIVLDQVLFHRRTRRSLHHFWVDLPVVLCKGPLLGARVVLMSLLALNQHRKPTAEVRANRGVAKPRRDTPKPAAALIDISVGPHQAQHLIAACGEHANEPRVSQIAQLVMEAILVRTLFDAHVSRSTERDRGPFPNWVKGCLDAAAPLLGDDLDVWRFRVQRMEAYHERRSFEPYTLPEHPHPYVEASTHLAWIYDHRRQDSCDETVERLRRVVQLWEQDGPGLVMLGPQITARRQNWSRDEQRIL